MSKPGWLNKRIDLGKSRKVKELLRDFDLTTVCEESLCPNISECFSRGVATFMILGDRCMRGCAFCGITRGQPRPVDDDEPARIRAAVERLRLDYVVITSPTRDDLEYGGAESFLRTVGAIKEIDPAPAVEILIPDFAGKKEALKIAVSSRAEVIAHNLETVPRLYPKVRKNGDYSRSLELLGRIKDININTITKSGIMLGLGEKKREVLEVLTELRRVNCDFLTLGQYLAPSTGHHPVKEYIPPDQFDYFKGKALGLGFRSVKSAPYVRSSYLAHK